MGDTLPGRRARRRRRLRPGRAARRGGRGPRHPAHLDQAGRRRLVGLQPVLDRQRPRPEGRRPVAARGGRPEKPWKIAALLGPGLLLRYVTGRLSLDAIARGLGRMAGCGPHRPHPLRPGGRGRGQAGRPRSGAADRVLQRPCSTQRLVMARLKSRSCGKSIYAHSSPSMDCTRTFISPWARSLMTLRYQRPRPSGERSRRSATATKRLAPSAENRRKPMDSASWSLDGLADGHEGDRRGWPPSCRRGRRFSCGRW